MGYYVEVPQNKDKVNKIIELFGGERVNKPKKFSDIAEDKALLCVVDNGPFEAAGFAYDEREFEAFSHSDGRPREWMTMDRGLAEKITGYDR